MISLRRAALLALPLAAALGLAAPAAATPSRSATTAGTAAAGSTLDIWAPMYMGNAGRLTQDQAVALARRVDVVIAQPNQFAGYSAAMHAANPDLTLLAYLNGTFARPDQGAAFPANWYVRTADGTQVRSVRWGNYMMNPRKPGWIADRVQTCSALLAADGYDGCALDLLGTTPVTDMTYVTGVPIDPRSGAQWTMSAWLSATVHLADAVHAAGPGMVGGNGLGNGPRYFASPAPSRRLFDGVQVGLAEVFLRLGTAPLDTFETPRQWQQEVDMVADAGRRGLRLVITTKAWADGSRASKDALHEYALASFLLGNDGSSRFCFSYDPSDIGTWYPLWDTDLGAPVGHYTQRPDGVFSRFFADGRVLVNPQTTAATVTLARSMVTRDGDTVTSVTLQPHTAAILTLPSAD